MTLDVPSFVKSILNWTFILLVLFFFGFERLKCRFQFFISFFSSFSNRFEYNATILESQKKKLPLWLPKKSNVVCFYPLGGTWCTTLLSRFEIGMSFRFRFPTLGCVACACLGRQNPTSLKDITSMCMNLIPMKSSHTFRTWGSPSHNDEHHPIHMSVLVATLLW